MTYELRDIVKKILQVCREDQSLAFGPRLQSSIITKKSLKETIASKRTLLKKSKETLAELNNKLERLKSSNDTMREELLESLGSEL